MTMEFTKQTTTCITIITIAIVDSIYSQSVRAPALHAGSMDNDAGRYCIKNSRQIVEILQFYLLTTRLVSEK